MGKSRKSYADRKPPVPSESHADIEDWIRRGVMPDMHPIVEWLDGFDPRDDPGAAIRHQVEAGVLRLARTRVDHRDGLLRRLRERRVLRRRGFRPSAAARDDGS